MTYSQAVTPYDPRWPQMLDELRALLAAGRGVTRLDTEFYEAPVLRAAAEASGRDLKRDDFDPWSTRLRCLQVGLPSGLCALVDFGRHRFDSISYDGYMRTHAPALPLCADLAEFLDLVGQLCAHRGISKCGVSLGTEALILRRHFGWRIRRPRDLMLASQVVWAGVAAKKARWTSAGLIKQEPLNHGFQATAARLGIEVDKEQQGSDWGAEVLTEEQLDYAALDVSDEKLGEAWRRIAALAKREGVLDSVIIECEAAPAFWECEWRGTPLDAEVCAGLVKRYREVGDQLYAEVSSTLSISSSNTRVGKHTEEGAVYIGRPRSGEMWGFGNPFMVGRDGAQGECVGKFRVWLASGDSQGCSDATESRRAWILANEHTLNNALLGCFCRASNQINPACHGDVYVERLSKKVPVEGEGSQRALAVGLTRWLQARGRSACLYRWERKVGERVEVKRGTDLTEEEARGEELPKPKKPTGKPKAPARLKRDSDAVYLGKVVKYQADCEVFEARLCEYAAALSDWEAAKRAPKWMFRPEMGEAALAPYDAEGPVSALMEARSCRSTEGALEKRLRNSWPAQDGRLATRCRYWQIAGGFDSGRGEADGAGAGTGRSSSSKPLNNQNVTTFPLGKARSKELALSNARICVRPGAGRAMVVGDFSQAHMRFFAQVSQDEALLDDFNAGRDAHIRLARDFFVACYPDDPLSQRSFAEWCEAYQAGKGHPLYDAIKAPRDPAKNGNYSFLNMGSAQKVRQIAETSPVPVHLPAFIEVDGVERDPWEVIRDRWREVYATGYKYQKAAIRSADRESHSFDFCEGEYGAVWSCDGKRRLYLLKEWNVPQWAESPEDGRYSVKGTEALAGIMQMSEANALKIALALVTEQFDLHFEWCAFVFNVVHDEIDAECAEAYKGEVAACVHAAMQEGMRRAGIVDLPTCAPDDTPDKLIVQSWADK